ncbi:hypothetical protein [Actinoplanes subtropicus]|uniref:hypothetical protein n=1 Tax=Actinoplanes subtropicus TaxID=543632 RepID=UPI0004C39F10|nr:hypothetical protein [Actinoplanes subtropicus]
MALLVEIHVPLPSPEEVEAGEQEHPFVWIEEVEEFLAGPDSEEVEIFDDGEQDGDVYIFFIAGADERTLLSAASRVAVLDRVPPGAFAMVTDDAAEEFGMGRRVDLPTT